MSLIRTITIDAVPGSFFVFNWKFNGANILSVDRVGFGRDETSVTPVNTEFLQVAGFLLFAIQFEAGEKVQVIYET